MARLASALGTVMIVLSVGGLAFLFFGPDPEELFHGAAHPVAPVVAPQAAPAPAAASQPATAPVQRSASAPIVPAPLLSQPAAPTPTPTLAPFVPAPQIATRIDRVAIPSIGLDSEVEEATLVERAGALTWEIPKFKAGHAQGTAGAGDDGNAVLLGHVSSVRSGDVFKGLDRVGVGAEVVLVGGGQRYVYEVTEVVTVSRADMAYLGSTEKPTVSLFTCTGSWLPTIWDYTDRLVVRGELRRIL